MSRRRIIPILLAAALLLAGCAPKAGGPTAAPGGAWSDDEKLVTSYASKLGSTPERDFTLKDLNGKQWTLSDLKGKVVLLNFWATWCGPCQNEMPDFQKMYERFGESGDAVVLAVASTALEGQDADQARAAVSEFVQEQGFTFPVLFDEDGAVWGTYQQQGIPANYIIDAQGNIRLLVPGAFPGEDSLYAALEAVRRADSGK